MYDSAQKDLWLSRFNDKLNELLVKTQGKAPASYFASLGFLLYYSGRYEEAEKALLRAAELSSTLISPPLGLCYVYTGMGKFDEAEKAILKYIQLTPLLFQGYAVYGDLKLFHQNKPIEAISYYQKALQCGRDLYEELFLIYLHTNQLDSAEAIAHQFITALPNDSRTRQRLGQLYLHKGMKEQARKQFERMTTLQPNGGDYYAYFPIIAYMQLGKADSLPALLETERLKANDHPDFYFMAACAFAFNGQNDLALQWLEGAFQRGWKCLLPECETPWYSLESPELYYLRQTPEYEALMKKYLPEYDKD